MKALALVVFELIFVKGVDVQRSILGDRWMFRLID